jgi:hypothetical protein
MVKRGNRMRHDDCPECDAFVAEMKAALTKQFGARPTRSREGVQQTVKRYLSLPDEAAARIQDSLATTKAAQIDARFLGASHKHSVAVVGWEE